MSKRRVRELAHLAAYSIRAAHDLDSAFVDGLDIAVYQEATGKFNFLKSEMLWVAAQDFDAAILDLFGTMATPLPFTKLESGS